MEKKHSWHERWQTGTTPWDIGAPHPRLPELLKMIPVEWSLKPQSSVVVPGCGTGHCADYFLNWRSDLTVKAFDYVPEAIEAAQNTLPQSKVQFLVADAFDAESFAANSFFAAYDRAMLCALQPDKRELYLENVHHWLAPGGLFIGFLFLQRSYDVEKGPPFQLTLDQFLELIDKKFDLLDFREHPYFEDDHVITREGLFVARSLKEK